MDSELTSALPEQGPVSACLDGSEGTRLVVVFRSEERQDAQTPMRARRDALGAAAELLLHAERRGRVVVGLSVTVGRMELEPSVPDAVPQLVRLSMLVRHADGELRTKAVEAILAYGQVVAARRGLEWSVESTESQEVSRS